ncbi:Predicted arabinose efflux permease, MFS family [Fontibacillus panacisegetis]|uniref:Predicted arabinose efflux permease, MFS family n=1 Tax=Fontibacillus panacisegetis TaxID=670482 RepID=A0A1G7GJX3_9BACL|nr:MFS transporter [Fontibacillus panacisegetis]SDE88309.1 Predicted arabinose efflux permease, MFS family [Fontibacillus panacisegetis]
MRKNNNKENTHTSDKIIFMLAAACGLIVANLYYAQTLVGPIRLDTHLSSTAAGLIVTLTQIGYVIGLLFIVPLSDIIENRRLTVVTLLVAIGGLLTAAIASNAAVFLSGALLVGFGSVVAQILVPYASYLTSEERSGSVVGTIMSGLLLGIMFARPIASFIAGLWSWRAVFVMSAIMISCLTILLARLLPRRQPSPEISYGKLLTSLGTLFLQTPALRRRAFYQAYLFGAFSLFWTVVPLRLTDDFGMSQGGIAWFALVGVAGAVAAPIAGKWADKGWTKLLTGIAMVVAVLSFLLIHVFSSHSTLSLILLFVSAITLDMAVSGNLVLGQRIIYSLGNETRGRLNGLFMSIFFIGGAVGSSLGGWAYAQGGWYLASLAGLFMPVIALLYYFTEPGKARYARMNGNNH